MLVITVKEVEYLDYKLKRWFIPPGTEIFALIDKGVGYYNGIAFYLFKDEYTTVN